MLFDPRGLLGFVFLFLFFFDNWAIKQVCSYKYLGVIMDKKIRWCEHVEFLCSKLDQSIHCLRSLRLLGLNEKNMLFFHSVLEKRY